MYCVETRLPVVNGYNSDYTAAILHDIATYSFRFYILLLRCARKLYCSP